MIRSEMLEGKSMFFKPAYSCWTKNFSRFPAFEATSNLFRFSPWSTTGVCYLNTRSIYPPALIEVTHRGLLPQHQVHFCQQIRIPSCLSLIYLFIYLIFLLLFASVCISLRLYVWFPRIYRKMFFFFFFWYLNLYLYLKNNEMMKKLAKDV